MSGLLIRTCAKVNLCLRVLGKRPDGYHEVETVMHAISLWDCLALRPAPEGARRLRVRGEAPEDGSNTCLRAAELMAEAAGRGDGLGIELQKAIPAGAGLGGGSSDAAATLAGLARLWETDISPPRLEAMAARIGADVPFFLRGGCCLARGRGEKLKTLSPVSLWLVLVAPGEPVSTAEAYAALGRGSASSSSPAVTLPVQRMTAALESGEPHAVAEALHNDFDEAGLTLPGLKAARRAKEALLSAGCLGACVSGSGSAAFGIARDLGEARAAAERLKEEWDWVEVVRTLSVGESMVISEMEGEAPREAGP